jgi:hypothetical protein
MAVRPSHGIDKATYRSFYLSTSSRRVDHHPIRLDMTVAESFPVPCQGVVPMAGLEIIAAVKGTVRTTRFVGSLP